MKLSIKNIIITVNKNKMYVNNNKIKVSREPVALQSYIEVAVD